MLCFVLEVGSAIYSRRLCPFPFYLCDRLAFRVLISMFIIKCSSKYLILVLPPAPRARASGLLCIPCIPVLSIICIFHLHMIFGGLFCII